MPLLVLWPVFALYWVQTHQLRSIPFPSDGFVRFQQLIINNISVFGGFWTSFTWTVVNIEITVFEAMEPITARCFTYSSISVKFWSSRCASAAIFFAFPWGRNDMKELKLEAGKRDKCRNTRSLKRGFYSLRGRSVIIRFRRKAEITSLLPGSG